MDHSPSASPDVLRRRGELLGQLRAFFDQRGFVEVQTPVLSADTVVDRHLDPVAVDLPADAHATTPARRMFLQTSPEFAMKRLLAAGEDGAPDRLTAIYQVCPAIRLGERGPLHNPEFTIVEWYRVGDDYAAGMDLLAELAEVLLDRGPTERITYADAFERHLGLDPHVATGEELAERARQLDVVTPAGLLPSDRDSWLELLLGEHVEPRLGHAAPTILHDYPAGQAMLARTRRDNAGREVAERFELYVGGIELANGYHELLDAEQLGHRNREANRQRRQDGKPMLPERSRLLQAMERGLPPCSGCALGFDRLAMVALGRERIDQVLPFPIERA